MEPNTSSQSSADAARRLTCVTVQRKVWLTGPELQQLVAARNQMQTTTASSDVVVTEPSLLTLLECDPHRDALWSIGPPQTSVWWSTASTRTMTVEVTSSIEVWFVPYQNSVAVSDAANVATAAREYSVTAHRDGSVNDGSGTHHGDLPLLATVALSEEAHRARRLAGSTDSDAGVLTVFLVGYSCAAPVSTQAERGDGCVYISISAGSSWVPHDANTTGRVTVNDGAVDTRCPHTARGLHTILEAASRRRRRFGDALPTGNGGSQHDVVPVHPLERAEGGGAAGYSTTDVPTSDSTTASLQHRAHCGGGRTDVRMAPESRATSRGPAAPTPPVLRLRHKNLIYEADDEHALLPDELAGFISAFAAFALDKEIVVTAVHRRDPSLLAPSHLYVLGPQLGRRVIANVNGRVYVELTALPRPSEEGTRLAVRISDGVVDTTNAHSIAAMKFILDSLLSDPET